MRVLVTGASGFIGQYVTRELAARGMDPVRFDRKAPTEILGDTRDRNSVWEAVATSDAVLHLAGVLGTQETIDNPFPSAETNVMGGLNVLEAVTGWGVPLVYIAVGNHWMNNTYSITKTTTERFCDMYSRFRGADVRVVRALNAYGPGQEPTPPWGHSQVRKIMPAFICRALEGEPIEVYGDGQQVMDMIHAADVATALVDVLERGKPGTVYEAGSGQPTTVLEIAQTVTDHCGGTITHLPMRPGEDESSVVLADPTTLEDIGWRQSIPLDVGVPDTVEWYRLRV